MPRSPRSTRRPVTGAASTAGSSRAAVTAATAPAPERSNAYTATAIVNAQLPVYASSQAPRRAASGPVGNRERNAPMTHSRS
jgi:hypothetical protein